jgi:probable O-glycosylation ligase (exosortase A-associated)
VTTALAFNPERSLMQLEKVLKINMMVFVVAMLVRTRREMLVFAWVLALSVAFYGIKGGIFTIVTGGGDRVYGPATSYISENNALAVALTTVIPLLRFLQTTLQQRWKRHMVTLFMVLCGVSILGSHSRGALLAITAMLALLWWRGKNKLTTGVLILAGGAVALSMMPDEWWQRMHTLQTYEEDRSAMGRLNAWTMAYNIARANLFGGGFSIYNAEVYGRYAPDPSFIVSAHSVYFHMMGEHGFIGLLIYLCLGVSVWRTCSWLRKHAKGQPQTEWCAQLGAMTQVSIVGFAVGAAFLSLTYYDLPYNMMVLVVAARWWVASGAWQRESDFQPNGRLFGIPLFFGDRQAPLKPLASTTR